MARPFFTVSHFCANYGGFESGLKKFFQLVNEHPHDLRFVANYFHISVAQASKYRSILARPLYVPTQATVEYVEFETSQNEWDIKERKEFLTDLQERSRVLTLVLPSTLRKTDSSRS